MKLTIQTSQDFDYQTTVDSHGWRSLAPFQYDRETKFLSRIQQLSNGLVVKLDFIDGGQEGLSVTVMGVDHLSPDDERRIKDVVARCFSMSWNLSAFYTAMRRHKGYNFIETEQLGRIMVSPTVWEDLVKTLMTTNTTWSQTIAMIDRLCQLGDEYSDGGHAFPTPQRIASMPLDDLSHHIRAGYRAPYLYELAQGIVSGMVDVESWYKGEIQSEDLYKTVKSLKGFGDYAAGTMLRLLGYFDRLAIDTACRTAYKFVTDSETVTDREIRDYYEPFGAWRGLVMWMDVLRS